MKTYISLALLTLAVAGCAPGTKVSTGGVTVETGGRSGPPGCPPGHAKKGWC